MLPCGVNISYTDAMISEIEAKPLDLRVKCEPDETNSESEDAEDIKPIYKGYKKCIIKQFRKFFKHQRYDRFSCIIMLGTISIVALEKIILLRKPETQVKIYYLHRYLIIFRIPVTRWWWYMLGDNEKIKVPTDISNISNKKDNIRTRNSFVLSTTAEKGKNTAVHI